MSTPDPARERLSLALDPERHPGPGLSPLNRAIMWAILASILVGVLETEPLVLEGRERLFAALHLVFFVLFALEYAGRLWVARLNPRSRSAWRYALRPASILDLVVLVTMLLPVVGANAAILRLARVLRLVRLARLGRFSVALRLLLSALREQREELAVSVFFAMGLLLVSAMLLSIVEGGVQPEAFGSVPRAMWWAVATLTTVGYGDVVPVTVLGRILAAITALGGIGLIALPAGILAGAFSDAIRAARRARQGQDGGES